MRRTLISAVLIIALCAAMAPKEAVAWGDRAQKSIAALSMQLLKNRYMDVFQPGDASFEQDVLRGAEAGVDALSGFVPLNSDAETVQAVSAEIQLLRDVQAYDTSSYFAYRMGVLSALVADIMVPFGFAWSPSEERIAEQISEDIDEQLDQYSFTKLSRDRQFIRDPKGYFRQNRAFYGEDKQLISGDYLGDAGYEGFLDKAGPAYFSRTVEAVADAWHTVLTADKEVIGSRQSQRQMTWYFVQEIEYLLQVKSNYQQALKAYQNLASLNTGNTQAFETVGDMFYRYGREKGGTQGLERGVREWQKAYEMGGPERRRISEKLADHYLTEGERYLERAATPEAEDADLTTALSAFEQALAFDRRSETAVDYIQETRVAIADRQERLQLTLDIIANAQRVQEEADKAKVEGDYNNALGKYQLALQIYEAVDEEFDKQHAIAEEGARAVNRSVNTLMEDVLEQASLAIEQGDDLQDQRQYDEAVQRYQTIEDILTVIPDDAKATHLKEKEDLLASMASKIDEAKQAKVRWEQQQQQQQAGGGGGGGQNMQQQQQQQAPAQAAAQTAPAQDGDDRGRGRRGR